MSEAVGGIAQGLGTAYAAKKQSESSKYGANIQNEIAKRDLAAQQALTGYQITSQEQLADALRSSYGNVQSQYGTGESNLSNLYAQTPEELETLKQQALTGQAKELQQGTSQLQSALASAGVRGTQAATQMRRGIGEMTESANQNIDKLIANEAMQRAQEQRQYTAGQQQAMQNYMLNPEMAKYSQGQTTAQSDELKKLLQNYMNVGK